MTVTPTLILPTIRGGRKQRLDSETILNRSRIKPVLNLIQYTGQGSAHGSERQKNKSLFNLARVSLLSQVTGREIYVTAADCACNRSPFFQAGNNKTNERFLAALEMTVV